MERFLAKVQMSYERKKNATGGGGRDKRDEQESVLDSRI